MKKIIGSLLIVLMYTQTPLIAQPITAPKDSIEIYLCKTWEVDYVLMGATKIELKPGIEGSKTEFKKDGTYIAINKKGEKIPSGTWYYDPKKRIIQLKDEKGMNNGSIISLQPGELIMLIDTKAATPDDPMAMKLVLKVKNQKTD